MMVVEDEEFTSVYPEIILNILIAQFYDAGEAAAFPEILTNKDAFKNSIKPYISIEWSKNTVKEITNQTLNFLNYRLPIDSMDVELGSLKTTLIANSEDIAQSYIMSLINCNSNAIIGIEEDATIFDLPPCKPDRIHLEIFVELTAQYLEDVFNKLPSQLSTMEIASINKAQAERFFHIFNVARWAVRLMPVLSVFLLILISILLKKEKGVMLKWIGRLLIITSSISLLILIVVIIGFDQFVALITNEFLALLIEGVGILVLGFIREIGYKTLLWVAISFAITLIIGIFLILLAKFIKPKANELQAENASESVLSSDGLQSLQEDTQREIEETEANSEE